MCLSASDGGRVWALLTKRKKKTSLSYDIVVAVVEKRAEGQSRRAFWAAVDGCRGSIMGV